MLVHMKNSWEHHLTYNSEQILAGAYLGTPGFSCSKDDHDSLRFLLL